MNEQLLRKAAGLCRQAAQQLRDSHSPEKEAAEVGDMMLARGFLKTSTERDGYVTRLVENPEKLAQAKETMAILPPRLGVNPIAEVSSATTKTAHGPDSWDKFFQS